jgi:ubiquitin-conjugating enzyme E2 A
MMVLMNNCINTMASRAKATSMRVILKNLERLNTPEGRVPLIKAFPLNEIDIYTWEAIIEGADGTPWAGSIFRLKMVFNEEFPHSPPSITFKDPIPFHPNVYRDGKICLDILQTGSSGKWAPVYGVDKILLSIQALLTDPNPDSPAHRDAAIMFTSDKAAYNAKIVEMAALSRKANKEYLDSLFFNEKGFPISAEEAAKLASTKAVKSSDPEMITNSTEG